MNSIKTIALKDLSYRYPLTERYVLQNINLKIEAGEKIALVGENGAGKTTLVKIISGMLSPSKGELLINDVPAGKIEPKALYQAMSAVMQEPARYNTFTVSDNVFIGDTKTSRSEEEIGRALKKAGFSGPSPQALLGKGLGGVELSGGEWQKLAIARGWYRDRDFIILDEPTSNLDPLAEEELFLRYLKLAEGRTVILVTHRISIAALCDRVLVLKGGRIFEDGSHHSLLGLKGEYAKLHGKQAHWYRR